MHCTSGGWKLRPKQGDDGGIFLTHAVLLLVRARKSRIVDHAFISAHADQTVRDVPDVALDRHTARGRAMGRSWPHFFEDSGLLADRETGELSLAPHLEDPYIERARAALEKPAPNRHIGSGATFEPAQMELDQEDR